VRVYVINLAESQARRASIGRQLEALGVRHAFFEAVDERHGYDHFPRYDEHAFLMNTGRTASAHEVACYASHLSMWKVCASSGEPILILEDDAELLPAFLAALSVTDGLVAPCGFIRLQTYGAARHTRTTPVQTIGAFTLLRCRSFPFGAMAYALSPRVAQEFVARSVTLTSPVDQFIRKFWEHGQPLFALSPGTVRGGPLSSQSTIMDREKHRLPPGLRLQRFLGKCADVTRRARFNWACRSSGMPAAAPFTSAPTRIRSSRRTPGTGPAADSSGPIGRGSARRSP
jgi:glycosyl transferase family 25